jgi:hypothetical protein
VLVCGQHDEEIVRLRGRAGFPLKKEPISTKCKRRVSAFECHANRAIGKLGIEAANAIEANQTWNDPMAPNLVNRAEPCGVEVRSVASKSVSVVRIAADSRPPVTAEVEDLHQHR